MAWSIKLDPKAERELRALDPQVGRRIYRFLSERLALLDDPRSLGEALSGPELGKYWKYRVGDYRIIASIEDQLLKILVIRIAHRGISLRPARSWEPTC